MTISLRGVQAGDLLIPCQFLHNTNNLKVFLTILRDFKNAYTNFFDF